MFIILHDISKVIYGALFGALAETIFGRLPVIVET
jgi:hypothetical protein